LVLVPFKVYAQDTQKRLSGWLLEQTPSPDDYPLGLSWRVPGERASQNDLRFNLLKSLSGLDPEVKAAPEALRALRGWLGALPVTGRALVAVADARWLQVNPGRDPVILPDHSVILPKRPRTVTVVTASGKRCRVMHASSREAKAYIDICDPANSQRIDWAWMAQPDGRVQRFGVAAWNLESQDEPAPGAWIWAPQRDGGWPENLSYRLIAFLATQGPAPDHEEKPAPDAPSNADIINSETVHRSTPDSWVTLELSDFGDATKDIREQSSTALPSVTEINPVISSGQSQAWTTLSISGFGSAKKNIHEQNAALSFPATEAVSARSRSHEVTAGDWGGVGLLQSPTARMRKAGAALFHLSRIYPYTNGNVFLQPFDWMEVGFRYTNISNRLYGPALAGNQAYKDKSIDAKFRIWNESAYMPQLAIGLRDMAGTGLFSGEYLVANKRTADFDWSMGLGWGYVGGRGNLRNPLGFVNKTFDTRNNIVGQGGNFALSSFFRGPAALFGGMQYQTPWEPLTVKLEYDGNNYRHEPLANNQPQRSPWNFGAVYRAARSVDLAFGVERGNTAMLGITLHTQLDELTVPKLNDPARVAVAATRPQQAPDWAATGSAIENQSDWQVQSIGQHGHELHVAVDDADAGYWRERMDRTIAVLHRDAPASVDRFTLTYRERGVEMAEHVIDRDAWVEQQTQALPPSERREAVIARPPAQAEPQSDPQEPFYRHTRQALDADLGMNYNYNLGGPDGFILYQISATERVKYRLRDDTWLQGRLQLSLIDNYDKFRFTGFSNLPRVRTFLREYQTTSSLTMPNLQLTHVGKFNENQYYSVYGGYLEEMFAGVGGEWLYRPFESRIALGVDANAVRQRDFRQDFSLRNYNVATGHATLYWDTGWNDVLANLSAGRYLAGDAGVTVQMSRAFRNGVNMGAYFSKTSATAVQFGEGSFDKGIFVNIPFDAMLTRSSSQVANFVWKPLTRDGGAKLDRAVMLYDVTKVRDDRSMHYEPAPPPNHASIPADRRENWNPPPREPEPYTRVMPKPTAKQWASDAQRYKQRLQEALYHQHFRNIQIAYDASYRLSVSLSSDRIHPISRAIGRAARAALLNAPLDAREIRIIFAERTDPVVTYDFLDLKQLQRYFNGEISQDKLADSVAVNYHHPMMVEEDAFAQLGDLGSDAKDQRIVDVLLPDMHPIDMARNDLGGAARTAADTDWFKAGAIGTGLVLASSMLDKSADRIAQNHAGSSWLKAGNNIGNALPFVAIAGAAATALGTSDPVLSRTGYTALESGAAALLLGTGMKYAVGRARPMNGVGNSSFSPFAGSPAAGTDGFPSGHTIIMWAVATPFAEEYNAPWLYGVAAATNFARVGSRQHWVSDTVAGSLLGYGIGKIFWESSHAPRNGGVRIQPHLSGVDVSWELQ
ncbi:MAG: YjbH domain-containing protein, partial [Gallionellaceae bacterium]|nr:YjbH domain-containing protein [Gallionellaceae bacterium]